MEQIKNNYTGRVDMKLSEIDDMIYEHKASGDTERFLRRMVYAYSDISNMSTFEGQFGISYFANKISICLMDVIRKGHPVNREVYEMAVVARHWIVDEVESACTGLAALSTVRSDALVDSYRRSLQLKSCACEKAGLNHREAVMTA